MLENSITYAILNLIVILFGIIGIIFRETNFLSFAASFGIVGAFVLIINYFQGGKNERTRINKRSREKWSNE